MSTLNRIRIQRGTVRTHRLAAAAALLGLQAAVQAATPFITTSRSEFLAALGSATTVTQDFESFADGTSLAGVAILPGVTLSTNLDSIAVFQGSGDKEAFATDRDEPEAEYYIDTGPGGYQAIGFDIDAFNPATPGPGFISFEFADGDTTFQLIPVLPTNATEDDPIFYGVVSTVPVTRVTWSEGPELGGSSCCEETALDNFVAVQVVPEPGSYALMAGGLAVGAALTARRRRSRR